MKKLLILLSALSVSLVYANETVNLDKQTVMCGDYKLTNKSTESDVIKHCNIKKLETEDHIIHKEQEVKFEATTQVLMKCEFSANKVDKCKIDD